ncbi:MAG: CDP-alcohol phosphatidyltransferase family protein [Planctomycetes bacterium]|nr:CDP-alcohol phosphatidyltransferase family protein [Planctomycetota bacterium]
MHPLITPLMHPISFLQVMSFEMTSKKQTHRSAVFSRLFGNNIARARQQVARGLIKLNIKPNTLTILGLIVTLSAAYFLTLGAGDKVGHSSNPQHSWCGFIAGLILILASACDMLDGAVARLTQKITQQGAFLDSSLDRIADGAIFTGILIYYLRQPDLPHSATCAALTMIALINAQTTSYVKARAENFIEKCPVGYWQRGERISAILIGLFSGHIATVMLILAILPAFTVFRRIIFARQQINRQENHQSLLDPNAPLNGIMRLALWRYRRGTWQYDLITAAIILTILLIDIQNLSYFN